MKAEPYRIFSPAESEVPILLSVPHCGTSFPEELADQYQPHLRVAPDDTDWFVDRLYGFAASLGIGMITAHYSRWVIDLNRDPQSKPLYTDGRIITGLCPVTDFMGNSIYVDQRTDISLDERERRVKLYYEPYHRKVGEMLAGLKARHGRVLLWDCHSIRQFVPTIQKEKFPDLILGDADGTSASPGIIEAALTTLDHSTYEVRHNHPFKGGYITRHFGNPADEIHALQLEMTKVNYMTDDEKKYDEARAGRMQELLINVFRKLIDQI